MPDKYNPKKILEKDLEDEDIGTISGGTCSKEELEKRQKNAVIKIEKRDLV